MCEDRRNGAIRLAEQMVGGRPQWRALDREERVDLLQVAYGLYDAGSTIGKAEEAERTRKDGFLYIIAHPKLDGFKVGRAFDPEARLASYQTGCPERAYYLRYVSPYFEDCKEIESRVHAELDVFRLQGEWFETHPIHIINVIERQSPFRSVQ